jgi:hypothetical protein
MNDKDILEKSKIKGGLNEKKEWIKPKCRKKRRG